MTSELRINVVRSLAQSNDICGCDVLNTYLSSPFPTTSFGSDRSADTSPMTVWTFQHEAPGWDRDYVCREGESVL